MTNSKDFERSVIDAQKKYDDATWDVYRDYGKSVIKQCKNQPKADATRARARMFIFMVGRGYSATQYSIIPFKTGTFSLNKMAEALIKVINNGHPKTEQNMVKILNSLKLKSAFTLRGKVHRSWLSKTCHILWPESCPIYDTRAKRTAWKIGLKIDGCKVKTIKEWEESWKNFLIGMKCVKSALGGLHKGITDYHELDKVLFYWGESSDKADEFANEFATAYKKKK
ncbi:MAG: hypothetical protein HY280_06725 [Nitrospinae bacterium]|nr:hypothetical protein [Nitrospinota bacterium]